MHLMLRVTLLIVLSFILTILPMPALIHDYRPAWSLLLLLYLQFYKPSSLHVILILLIGFGLDVLTTEILGTHAFALLIGYGVATAKARRFPFLGIGAQSLYVGMVVLSYQVTLMGIDAFLGQPRHLVPMLISTLISTMLWPWVKILAYDSLSQKERKNLYYSSKL